MGLGTKLLPAAQGFLLIFGKNSHFNVIRKHFARFWSPGDAEVPLAHPGCATGLRYYGLIMIKKFNIKHGNIIIWASFCCNEIVRKLRNYFNKSCIYE